MRRPFPVALALVVVILAIPIAWGLTLDPIEGSLRHALRAPSLAHPLGTDSLGRDVLARIAHAFVLDLSLAAVIVGASLAIGTAMGLTAGFVGGPVDAVVCFVMDLVNALPQVVVAIVFAVAFGHGLVPLVLALALTGWVKYARIVRAEVFVLREAEFVTVARVLGAGRLRILVRHVLPNVLPLMAGLVALQAGHAILNIATLGFLGLGVQPPTPEWGAMIAQARPYLGRAPWLAVAPGAFLFAFTLVFVLAARRLSPSRPDRVPGGRHALA